MNDTTIKSVDVPSVSRRTGASLAVERRSNGGLNPRRWQPRAAWRDDLPLMPSMFDTAPATSEADL